MIGEEIVMCLRVLVFDNRPERRAPSRAAEVGLKAVLPLPSMPSR